LKNKLVIEILKNLAAILVGEFPSA